jgi:hypothetical protein
MNKARLRALIVRYKPASVTLKVTKGRRYGREDV